MSPLFGHGHLRLYLLKLLDESPKHGYDLMQALSERSGGTYSPSAGTIYPRLAKLEDEGLVVKETEGRKTTYSITPAGREELASRADELRAIEDGLDSSIRGLAAEVRVDVDQAMRRLRAELAGAARQSRREGAHQEPAAATDPRVTVRAALREGEMALSEFRTRMRTTLRTRAADGSLTAEQVRTLADDLRALSDRFVRG